MNGEEISLRFLGLEDVFKGTFDLATCGNTANDLVITTDVERFFKVREENEDKVVILIALRQLVEQKINFSAEPFEPIMEEWDVSKAPVGIFWRWGNQSDSSFFDYLTAPSLFVLSSKDLYENWYTGAKRGVGRAWAAGVFARARAACGTHFMFVL